MAGLVASNPSLAELARACGLSRGHFTRAFKITTGLSPHQWLLRHRIEKARDMLVRTELPLAQIALRCGFADQSHLTRVFGMAVGDSPAAWRRRAK
jgi:AraC-like DNA-binding protein